MKCSCFFGLVYLISNDLGQIKIASSWKDHGTAVYFQLDVMLRMPVFTLDDAELTSVTHSWSYQGFVLERTAEMSFGAGKDL